jgi:choline-sulfatase
MPLRRRRLLARAASAAGLLALAAACGGRPGPSILLVTFDTTRADRIGAYGHARAFTPTLDGLAREGVLFEHAVAPAPITLPAHASILTGVSPAEHGVRDNTIFFLGPAARLVSEALAEHGWRTGAFVGSFVLDARFGLDQGFEVYSGPSGSDESAERPAGAVVDAAIAWLSQLPADAPYFAWVHFYDPHRPFAPPPLWTRRGADPYDDEIGYADEELGRLLHFLDERGLARHLLVVATADHGEALGEHGQESHGALLYQATLRVPLVFSGSALPAALRGTRVPTPVSTVDVGPTLIALAGLPAAALPAAKGRPLLDAHGVVPAPAGGREIYFETLLPYYSFRWRAQRGLWVGDRKLIESGTPQLYAPLSDPRELHDLAGREPGRTEALRERLRAWEERHPALGWGAPRNASGDEIALLASLGYVSAAGTDDPFSDSLPDAGVRIGDVRRLSKAENLIARASLQPPGRRERGQAQLLQAKALLEQVQRANPHDPHLPFDLGVVEFGLGNGAAAVPLLEEAARQRSWNPRVHEGLAAAYQAVGRTDEARREMDEALRLDPGSAEASRWLEQHRP